MKIFYLFFIFFIFYGCDNFDVEKIKHERDNPFEGSSFNNTIRKYSKVIKYS